MISLYSFDIVNDMSLMVLKTVASRAPGQPGQSHRLELGGMNMAKHSFPQSWHSLYTIMLTHIICMRLFCCSRGYADGEIEALFAKYDIDGDRVLDEDEQRKMLSDLNDQKVKH